MHESLYPHPPSDSCPYCKSENVQNDLDEFYPSANDCVIPVRCDDCDRVHYLNYEPASITLVAEDGTQQNYHLGRLVPDMSKEGEPDQGKTLVAAVVGSDGLFIMAQGYCDGASTYGYGCPVIIEMYQDQLRVIAWANITDDDVSDIIELDGAKIEHDKFDPYTSEAWYGLRLNTPQDGVVCEHLFGSTEEAQQYKTTVPPGHYLTIVDRRKDNEVVWDSRQ